MNSVKTIFSFLFVYAGIILILWSGVSVFVEVYEFWRFGQEKNALILELNDKRKNFKAGWTYNYTLIIDETEVRVDFKQKLPVGNIIKILVINEKQKTRVCLGDQGSSIFSIYRSILGGSVWAILVSLVFMFMIFVLIALTLGIYKTYYASKKS